MFDVFYDDDYISVGVEWRNNEPFFHHHVKKWNTTANRVMMREVENLIKLLRSIILRLTNVCALKFLLACLVLWLLADQLLLRKFLLIWYILCNL